MDPRISTITRLLADCLSSIHHPERPLLSLALSDAERAVALLGDLYAEAQLARQRAKEVTEAP